MIKFLPIEGMKTCLINSKFGMRTHPITKLRTMHNGIDYPCKEGTPVYAVDSGKVVVSRMQADGKGLGNYITILHSDGQYSLYAHLKTRQVSFGNFVKAGQQIGLSGNTGSSTGAHLHFGICKDYVSGSVNKSAWINPMEQLKAVEGTEVIKIKKVLLDGEAVEVEMSVHGEGTSKEVNYIKLRELEKLGIEVGYNAAQKCPTLKSK